MFTCVRQAAQRVCILIDADNIELTGLGRRIVNFVKLLERMNGRLIVRAILYRRGHRLPPRILRVYEEAGIEVRLTPANADASMMVDALGFAGRYDVIAFVSGDHFVGVIAPMLKSLGAKVEAWAWPDSTAEEVKRQVNEYIPLTPDLIIKRRLRGQTNEREASNGRLGDRPDRSGKTGAREEETYTTGL